MIATATTTTTTQGGEGDDHPRNDGPFDQLFRKLRRQHLASYVEEEDEDNDKRSPTSLSSSSSLSYRFVIQSSVRSHLRVLGAEHEFSCAVAPEEEVASKNDVYKRAGVWTPAESAWRDWHGGSSLWRDQILTSLCRCSDAVVYVQTIAPRKGQPDNDGNQSCDDNLLVMDVSLDPFGWNTDPEATTDKDESKYRRSSPNSCYCMEDLDGLVNVIRQRQQQSAAAAAVEATSDAQEVAPPTSSDRTTTTAKPHHSISIIRRFFVPVVVQSLTPLLHRHGFDRTMGFLREVERTGCCPVLVVFTTVESMTSQQHLRLERRASALLSIERGGAVLVRQGIRERSNVIRESLVLDFFGPPSFSSSSKHHSSGNRRQRVRVRCVADHGGAVTTTTTSTSPPEPEPEPVLNSSKARRSTVTPPGKKGQAKRQIQLSLSEDDSDAPHRTPTLLSSNPNSSNDATASFATTSTNSHEPPPQQIQLQEQQPQQPRIIIQDDDPEFDDYDEEDPDDDLDL